MPYTPQTWVDGQAGGTPVNADRLNHIEQGLADAAAGIDTVAQAVTAVNARPGNLVVFLGDSITAGSDTNDNLNRSVSWPNYAAIISGQRLQYVYNAGIPGNTTASMLARFDSDVTPYAPAVVTLLCGTNDLSSRSLSAWSADVAAIVAKVREIGAVPVLATLPPTNTTDYKTAVATFNGWLRRYAATEGLTLLDFYGVLADPTTSDYRAAYLNDGTHPNPAGTLAMGQLAATVLGPLLPNNAPQLCVSDADPLSSIYRGCFGGYTDSVMPTGWVDNASTPAGSVLSYTTDPAVPGQLLTLTATNTGALRQLSYWQYFGATTLSGSVAAGATSLTLPIRADYAGVLFIGAGPTFEVVKILSSSGGGPQTETLVSPLKYAHDAGELVVANAAPGDELILSAVVTISGTAPASLKTAIPGAPYSPGPMSVLPGPITRGVVHQRFTLPVGSAGPMEIRLQQEAGTGVLSVGQLGLYNATRNGW